MGQMIRELREAAKLSLRDMGDLLKDRATGTPVSAAFLSDIENGHRFPSDDLLGRLALVLRADADELRRHDQRPPSRELQDLATMNPRFAFAFRRAVEIIHEQKLTPQDVVRRIEFEPTREPEKEHEQG
jgi:transcriptional regulator with XRE-family HTH domain